MKKVILILGFYLLVFSINAQNNPPAIQWQKCYGGTSNDQANSIQQTSDGGYIVAGFTESNNGNVILFHGAVDFWIVKLDSLGIFQWQKCLGGTDIERAYSIQQTNDGGYIVAGYTISNNIDVSNNHDTTGYYADYWIVKLDSIGNILWQKCYGGTNNDRAYSIQQTNDGGYIVAGNTNSNDGDVSGHNGYSIFSDYWIVKLDTFGNIQWQKSLGGTSHDLSNFIQQTFDGGYIVAGHSSSNDGDVTGHLGVSGHLGTTDYWIVKLDTIGNIQWQKSLGGTGNEQANFIQQTNDSGYIVAGYTTSNNFDVSNNHDTTGNYSDYWIVKLNSAGNIQWQKCLGGSDNDIAYSINQTNNGSYIIAGISNSNNGDVSVNNGQGDYWIVKLDSIGNILWQKCYGGSNDEYAKSIQQTNDGGYIAAGYSYSNNGNVSNNKGYIDYWIVKLAPYPMNIKEQTNTIEASIYPNPSKNMFTVSVPQHTGYIEVSNSLGQLIEKRTVKNESELSFEIKQNGMYFIKVVTDKEIVTKKIVINK